MKKNKFQHDAEVRLVFMIKEQAPLGTRRLSITATKQGKIKMAVWNDKKFDHKSLLKIELKNEIEKMVDDAFKRLRI